LNENARTIRLPVNVVQELQKEKRQADAGLTELSSKFANLPSTIRLDNTINEEGDTLVDVIVNQDSLMPDHSFNNNDAMKEKLSEVLSVLDERERMIVEDYFGLSGTPRTLEDIGEDFNLTKERVRQIKEKALRKLRNESGILFEYL
jgi:RNA polymerase primary sigma factor